MSEIPEDIVAKARALDRRLEGLILVDCNGPYIAVDGVEEIARAILAERAANAATLENECREAEKRGYERGLKDSARVAEFVSAKAATAIRAMKEG